MVDHDPNQYFFYTDMSRWDWVFGRSPYKSAVTRFFTEFLLEQKPDLVHFQHTMYMGYDILRASAKRPAGCAHRLHAARVPADLPPQRPDGPHDGRIAVRPRFPAPLPRVLPAHPATGVLHAQALRGVALLAGGPVRDAVAVGARAVRALGDPRERIVCEPHGFVPAQPVPEREDRPVTASASSASSRSSRAPTSCRERGRRWARTSPGRLWIHGANLDTAPADFQEEFSSLLEEAGDGCGWWASTVATTSRS